MQILQAKNSIKIKTEELKRETQLRLLMHMKSKSVPLVETHYGTVLSNMVWNLFFSTEYLPLLMYGINSSFKFSCIPIGQQVNLTLISSVLFPSLIQQFGCPKGGGWHLCFLQSLNIMQCAGVLLSTATNWTEKLQTGCSENESTIHWKSYSLRVLVKKRKIIRQ